MVWIVRNIDVIIGIIALLIVLGMAIWKFILGGKEGQISKIQEWLLYAVIEAEKELGGGTGQVKLRYVYDMFIDKFKFAKIFITFKMFSEMVDDSLDIMRGMLSTNGKVKDYVEKK